jgi:tetratricopeptide (TPR) repeat protein
VLRILLQRRWCWCYLKSFRHLLPRLLFPHATTFPPSSTKYRYGLDPAQYPLPVDLQRAILLRRAHLCSLLVLDNIETLIDAQRRNHPEAVAMASFISRLKEGEGAVLFTSRMVPPADWGDCQIVSIPGLSDEAGAVLFIALLPADREHLAPLVARQALSQRVLGHPLSIKLLSGRFADETATDLVTFLENIEAELEAAEQATPTSLEDPERQRTLYACMDYSVKRLTLEQRKVLDVVNLFQAPFLPAFAAIVLKNEERTPVLLLNLVRLGLLTMDIKTFKEGELILLEMHPMLRWYIQDQLAELDITLQERYGEVYNQLAWLSKQQGSGYDQSSLMRYLIRQSLPDFEAALKYLPAADKSSLAYRLAEPYQRLGQNRRALALYEEALEIIQELGDVRGVTVTQHAMAGVLVDLGKPQEALALYEQSLRIRQELRDVRGIALTQTHLSQLLFEYGAHRRAMPMAWEAYTSLSLYGYSYNAQIMQQLLKSIKGEVLSPDQFDVLWEQVIQNPQPEWLRDVQASSPIEQVNLTPETLNVMVSNTVAVMTVMREKCDEWRETMIKVLQQAQSANRQQDAQFFNAILGVLDGQSPVLTEGNPYTEELNEIHAGIVAGVSQGEETSVALSDEVMQAMNDFVNAEDWDATRQVLEEQHAYLFQPEVETLLEQNITGAKAVGEQRAVRMLEQHLSLLRECKTVGIVEVFERLTAEGKEALPFDAELIPRSIAALLGGPQKKWSTRNTLLCWLFRPLMKI